MNRTLIAATAVGLAASAAFAAPTRFLNDGSGGATYSANIDGQSVSIGLLGWTDGTANESFSASDLMAALDVRSGNIVGLFNGQDRNFFDGDFTTNSPIQREYSFGDPLFMAGGLSAGDTLTQFTGITTLTDGRHFRAVLVAFTGSNLVLNRPQGGTSTFGANGDLGDLGDVAVRAIPLPGPAAMAAVGVAAVATRRRRA